MMIQFEHLSRKPTEPKPQYDTRIAAICAWLRRHVTLAGIVTLRKKS